MKTTINSFDISKFQDAITRNWQYLAACDRLYWSFEEQEDGVLQIAVAPIFQIIEGEKGWSGFEFDLSGFLSDEGVVPIGFGMESYCIGCTPTPFVGVRGTFHGVPFLLRLHLEPIPGTDPIIETNFAEEKRIVSKIIELSGDNFDAEVLRADVPVLVDFFGEFCSPCRLLKPVLVELASELGDQAKVGTVDVEADGSLAERYGINVVPTLIVFRGGREIHRLVGLKTKDYLRQSLEV